MSDDYVPPPNPRDVARKERELAQQLLAEASKDAEETMQEVVKDGGSPVHVLTANFTLLDYGRKLRLAVVLEGVSPRLVLPLGVLTATRDLHKPGHFEPKDCAELFGEVVHRFRYLRKEPVRA